MNSRPTINPKRVSAAGVANQAHRATSAPLAESPRKKTRTKLVTCAVAAIGVAVAGAILLPRSLVEPAYDGVADDSPPPASVSLPEVPVSAPAPVAQTGEIEPPGVAKPLKLFAVRPGSNSREGTAVLGPAEASSRTYVVGAILENGARLIEVFDDRALLRRDGRTYTLYLPDRGPSAWLAADTSELTVGDYAPPAADVVRPIFRVTDFLRTVPAYDGDAVVGFSAYPGTRSAQFDSWGLLPGDVLVAAGGYSLTDPTQMEAVLDRLGTGAVLVADVIRGGRERRRVTLDGSALVAAADVSPQVASPPPIL